jgi:hypothetical protein
MNHIPSTTRIFIGLFIITMLLTYLALNLTTQYNSSIGYFNSPINQLRKPKVSQQPAVKLLDTATWSTYTDKTYPISFKYPKGWTVVASPATKDGFADITIKPTDKTPNLHITVSKNGYFALDGLKLEPYKLGNVEGESVNGSLIGVKSGEYYYTFDATLNPKFIAEFQTLMSTVEFQQTLVPQS